MKTVRVIGLPIAIVDYASAAAWCLQHAKKRDAVYAVEAANTHVAAMARSDERFGKAMDKFDLICPDGMPLLWAVNGQLPATEKLKERVYGPDLMLEVIRATMNKPAEFSHFLLGGMPSTLEKLTSHFSEKFPTAKIAGNYSPPFGQWSDEEFQKISAKISKSGANMIWVGLGCPKQELWIAENKHRLPTGVYFGIGAAFAFHAGEVSQAPALLQKIGLEWLYRLLMEPKRLFRRYFTYNSLFLYHLIRDHTTD